MSEAVVPEPSVHDPDHPLLEQLKGVIRSTDNVSPIEILQIIQIAQVALDVAAKAGVSITNLVQEIEAARANGGLLSDEQLKVHADAATAAVAAL